MAAAGDFDAEAELARFHESRAGVRGLVESGVTAVPPLFSTPTVPAPQAPATPPAFTVPIVDLSLPRADTVALVGAAARSRGFFHVTNHRVPAGIMAAAARAFHEEPLAARSAFYSLHPVGSVAYSTVEGSGGISRISAFLSCTDIRVTNQSQNLRRLPM